MIKAVTISGINSSGDLKVDTSGNVQAATQLKLEDGSIILDIAKNTKLVDINGKALESLSVSKPISLPEPPPQSVIVMGYEFGPDGAQFDPPLTLTLTYDPKTLPSGADGNKLTLAFWDGFKWISVESKVDAATHTVIAQISHFSEYALLAELPPAKFTLSDLKITEDKSSPEDPVTIQMVVTNIGGSPGKYTVKLTLNSFGVNQKEVSLQAGKSQTVSFELKNLIPAKYTVDINGTSSQFTIESPSLVAPQLSSTPEPVATAASTPLSVTVPPPVAATTTPPLPEKKTTIPALWLMIVLVVVLGLIAGIILTRRKTTHS